MAFTEAVFFALKILPLNPKNFPLYPVHHLLRLPCRALLLFPGGRVPAHDRATAAADAGVGEGFIPRGRGCAHRANAAPGRAARVPGPRHRAGPGAGSALTPAC